MYVHNKFVKMATPFYSMTVDIESIFNLVKANKVSLAIQD